MKRTLLIVGITLSIIALFSAGPLRHYPNSFTHGDSLTLDSNIGGQYIGGSLQLPSYANTDSTKFLSLDDSGYLVLRPVPGSGNPVLADKQIAFGSSVNAITSSPNFFFEGNNANIKGVGGGYKVLNNSGDIIGWLLGGDILIKSNDGLTGIEVYVQLDGTVCRLNYFNNLGGNTYVSAVTSPNTNFISYQDGSGFLAFLTNIADTANNLRSALADSTSDIRNDIPSSTFIRNLFSAGTGISYDASTGVISSTGGGSGSVGVDLVNQTAAPTVSYVYTVASTGMYQLGLWVNINSLVAPSANFFVDVIYVDAHNVSHTRPFIPYGTASAYLNGNTDFIFPPFSVKAKAGSTIQFVTALNVSGGSINYDISPRVTPQ